MTVIIPFSLEETQEKMRKLVEGHEDFVYSKDTCRYTEVINAEAVIKDLREPLEFRPSCLVGQFLYLENLATVDQ